MGKSDLIYIDSAHMNHRQIGPLPNRPPSNWPQKYYLVKSAPYKIFYGQIGPLEINIWSNRPPGCRQISVQMIYVFSQHHIYIGVTCELNYKINNIIAMILIYYLY